MAMKLNDWLVASLNNPEFTAQDFKDVSGMTLDNTLFMTKDAYKSSPYIRNLKMFQDSDGNFSDQKFDNYYDTIASSFKDFSTENTVDNYEYSMWDVNRPVNGRVKNINFNLNTVNNPEHIRIGVGGINAITASTKSRRELALNSKIFDPATGKYLDKSVNDISLFTNPFEYISSLFDDPLVYATYDEDTIEVDPVTGNKVKHLKGEWKVNEDGEYYTEKANGRNLRGKSVVSAADYLTSENSIINKYDFFDSDDLEKSVAGTVAKNIAAVIPMFIPYVNTAYSGLLVGRELMKTLPMAYGMVSSLMGNENPNSQLANTIAAYGLKFSGSTSDYAQEKTFAFENFGNLMSDVALLWGLQKFIANTFNKLRGGGETALNTATVKAQKTYIDNANKYILESLEGKISKALLASYLGTDDPYNVSKLFESGKWAETALGKAALNKYIPAAEKIMENRNRLALDLSLGYMALISNTDVYESVLEKGGTPAEAAAIAFGSTLGMYSVDKYLGLGEMFFEKDPARAALRKAARENAELYMAGRKEAADLTTKKGIIGTILKGINVGKSIVNKFGEKYKDGALGLAGKALGEGTEEVSEELVTDLTKSLGELAGRLGYFSQTDYGAWENMGERYIMSFLGGTAGGAMFGGVEAWNNRNNSTKDFQNEIMYLLRQGKKKDIFDELKKLRDKGVLGSSNLSYDSTTNSDGTKTYITADTDHKSLADSNYENLSNIINLLDLILNSNLLNLSEDELFDKMVLGEYRANTLTDFLKGDTIENVKNISYISRFLEDFQKLANSIVNKENEIQELINTTTDEAKRKSPEYQEKLLKLQLEKQELLDLKEYLFGEGSLGYVEKTLFAMDTNLSGRFVALNINQFARELTGKSIQLLTPAELQSVQNKYNEWTNGLAVDVDKAFSIYKNMEKLVLPELKSFQETDFNKELKAIEKLRKDDPSKKLLNVTDKLDSETDEEYASLFAPLEGESEEDFKARQKAHEDAIRKYNIDNLFKWIQEFAKLPITSTDFRYFISKIGALRGELLKYYLDNISDDITKKHWWEMRISTSDDSEINPDDEADINKQNKDLYDLILKKGILDVSSLKTAIKERINKTAASIVRRKYENIAGVSEDPLVTDALKYISTLSSDEKENIGVPSDYSFENKDIITYKDLYTYIKHDMNLTGLSLDEEIDNLSTDLDNIDNFLEFYAQAAIDHALLESPIAESIIDVSENYYNELVKNTSDSISENYFKNLDVFIKAVNDSPQTKTLNALEGTTFINNPVISLLNKISKFSPNSKVNIEELLQDIYNTYNSLETNSDFQLSDSQLSSLKQVLEDFKTAEAFIYGASVRETDSTPVGHNKSINDFVKNHSDVFGKTEELPEIKEEDANMLLGEIAAYKKEINSWIDKHENNVGLRDIKFIKADEALRKSIQQFFELNRNAFKISPTVDLLDGFEDLTLDNSLSSVVALLELLYSNFLKSNLTLSDVLDKLSESVFNSKDALDLESAKLDENLTYSQLTHYDKFLLIVTAMSVSTVKYYKKLKTFLDANSNMAPLSTLEYVSKTSFALNENPKAINEALTWLKNKSGSKMDIAFNTSVVTGLGGSGKTFAIAKLNLGAGKDAWLSGPTKSLVDNLKKSLPDGMEKSKLDLFNIIFGGKTPNTKDLYTTLRESGTTIANLKDSIKVLKIDNPPKYIVIDEATHFSTPEILIISKFCNANNINLILLGDEHLKGYFKDNIGNIESNSLISWRTSPLYISLRNGNALKVTNLNPLLLVIDKLSVENIGAIGNSVYESIFKNILFKYYNKDTFNGELITDTIPNDILGKIPKDATVGFIGDAISPEYKKLLDAGLNVSDPLLPLDVQGREFDYVVVDKRWELTLDDDWNNNNIKINLFSKELYTLITRSSKGTILIDNGLSNIIGNINSQFNGEYSGLSASIQKFRDKRIPEIEKVLEDNTETIIDNTGNNDNTTKDTTDDAPDDSSSDSSDNTPVVIGGDTIHETDLEEEKTPIIEENNTDEEEESANSEEEAIITPSHPIVTYSSVSYSGINTAGDTWINDNNSTSDLGIFILPGKSISTGKVDMMKKVVQLKNLIIFGSEYYDRLPIEIKEKFSPEAFDNVQYFIKIEDVSDSNRLIGLTKGSGLTNENRAVRGKVIKLIAKLEGRDGTTYSVSLGGLNNPDTWAKNAPNIKEAIKKRIENGAENKEELQSLYDSYDDIISKYSTTVDNWVRANQEFRINPPKFSLYTRLIGLGSSYRLEDSVSTFSPYREMAPILVESEVNIVLDDIPGVSSKMKGKPVMFVSSNLLLNPSELKDIYIKLTLDPTLPKLVRMVCLDNVGVSFKSLYQKKWSELYNNKVGKCTFTTPMELQPFAIRMYKSMWNYRAGLSRFIERYNTFCKEKGLTDEDVLKLCQADNAEYQRQRGNSTLDEATYRKRVSPELASKLSVLWEFNDSLADYVKEFRLGYESTHGAYLRKLTNIDSKFYKAPEKAVGIYINPEIAKTQLAVLDNIFTNIIDIIVPPTEANHKSYITTDLKEWKDEEGGKGKWFLHVTMHNSIALDFQEENASTKSTLNITDKTNLTVLPLVMIKAAHYINVLMTEGKENFLDFVVTKASEGIEVYNIKYLDSPINWLGIIDPINNQVAADKTADYTNSIPGVIPYDKKSGTGVYDSRMDDLFNLMFHGVISTPVENDFTRDNIRASFAEFKFGIFSDPILVEKKNDVSGLFDRTVTNKKLFSSNVVASGPVILIDISPYSETSSVEHKVEEEIETPILKLHNKIKDVIELSNIDIDPKDFNTLEEYLEDLNLQVEERLLLFVQNSSGIDFNNVISSIDNTGNIVYLKDLIEFSGLTFKSMKIIPNGKRITMLDAAGNEQIFNMHYDEDGLSIKKDTPILTHPDNISIEEAKNNILNVTKLFFDSIAEKDSDLDKAEEVELFMEEMNKFLSGNVIAWKTYGAIINKLSGYLRDNYDDFEDDLIKVTKDLANLLNSCSI